MSKINGNPQIQNTLKCPPGNVLGREDEGIKLTLVQEGGSCR